MLLGAAGLLACATLFAHPMEARSPSLFRILPDLSPLGPVLNARWMPASVFGERYLYLPSVGSAGSGMRRRNTLECAKDTAFRQFSRPLARAVPVLVAVVALVYAVRTVTRNRDWTSDEVLFRQALQSQGDASLVRSDLGAVYFNHGNLARPRANGRRHFPTDPQRLRLDNMALLRQHQHRYLESLDYSCRALRGRPAYTMAHVNLAETLADLGRDAEAEWQFRIATTLTPLSTRAHNGLR